MTLNEWIAENGNKSIEITEDGTVKVLPEEKKGRWKPEKDQVYFFLGHKGDIIADCNRHSDTDSAHFAMGNIFTTKEEAEAMLERLKIRAELLDCGGREVFKLGGDNFYIGYYAKYIDISKASYYVSHDIFFDTEEDAENASKTIGEERLKKYWFRVEESEDN